VLIAWAMVVLGIVAACRLRRVRLYLLLTCCYIAKGFWLSPLGAAWFPIYRAIKAHYYGVYILWLRAYLFLLGVKGGN